MAEAALSMVDGAMPGELAAQGPPVEPGRAVVWVIGAIGLVTALMAAAVAFYRAPSGVFADHKLPYYGIAAAAFASGIAEAWVAAAIWFSADPRRHRRVGRCVVYASVLPLAVIAGLGGLSMLIK